MHFRLRVIRILGIVEESCHATAGFEKLFPPAVQRESHMNHAKASPKAFMQPLWFGPKISSERTTRLHFP